MINAFGHIKKCNSYRQSTHMYFSAKSCIERECKQNEHDQILIINMILWNYVFAMPSVATAVLNRLKDISCHSITLICSSSDAIVVNGSRLKNKFVFFFYDQFY